MLESFLVFTQSAEHTDCSQSHKIEDVYHCLIPQWIWKTLKFKYQIYYRVIIISFLYCLPINLDYRHIFPLPLHCLGSYIFFKVFINYSETEEVLKTMCRQERIWFENSKKKCSWFHVTFLIFQELQLDKTSNSFWFSVTFQYFSFLSCYKILPLNSFKIFSKIGFKKKSNITEENYASWDTKMQSKYINVM